MYAYRSIGLIAKDGGTPVADTLAKISDHLRGGGAEVVPDRIAARLLGAGGDGALSHIGQACDVAIVIGGDGTLLGAARELAPYDVPLIGVNLGRLGFLVDVPPGNDLATLDAILSGQHQAEQRFLLQADVLRDGARVFHERAFNDVILRVRERVRLLEFQTFVDGHFVTMQRADGMIAASPTGSTAYALSSGGPVLTPATQAILLLPICSHTFSSRPLVVRDDSVIELRVCDEAEDAAQLVCDGQINFPVVTGDAIQVRRADHGITLLHPQDHDFYDLLRKKLNWV